MVHLEDILYIPSIIIFGGTGSGCTVAIMGRWGKEKKGCDGCRQCHGGFYFGLRSMEMALYMKGELI